MALSDRIASLDAFLSLQVEALENEEAKQQRDRQNRTNRHSDIQARVPPRERNDSESVGSSVDAGLPIRNRDAVRIQRVSADEVVRPGDVLVEHVVDGGASGGVRRG